MHSVLCLFMQTQCKCRRSRVAIDLSQNGRVQVGHHHASYQLTCCSVEHMLCMLSLLHTSHCQIRQEGSSQC